MAAASCGGVVSRAFEPLAAASARRQKGHSLKAKLIARRHWEQRHRMTAVRPHYQPDETVFTS